MKLLAVYYVPPQSSLAIGGRLMEELPANVLPDGSVWHSGEVMRVSWPMADGATKLEWWLIPDD